MQIVIDKISREKSSEIFTKIPTFLYGNTIS